MQNPVKDYVNKASYDNLFHQFFAWDEDVLEKEKKQRLLHFKLKPFK